ncbi:Hypothetical predicted protein [Pelobates cultripes]|uniref:Uncharacterized protein n=1 Tax=Pelobates cultripes TaxID=61616 RepID=A0AAD1T055_PELCU|nr:Hypothetical predicted protein [Pelobates cultripes]
MDPVYKPQETRGWPPSHLRGDLPLQHGATGGFWDLRPICVGLELPRSPETDSPFTSAFFEDSDHGIHITVIQPAITCQLTSNIPRLSAQQQLEAFTEETSFFSVSIFHVASFTSVTWLRVPELAPLSVCVRIRRTAKGSGASRNTGTNYWSESYFTRKYLNGCVEPKTSSYGLYRSQVKT